jgi:membrane-associated phospholipid phosphatase
MLALRANDNSALVVPYAPIVLPGFWVPTPPAFAPALLPNWPLVTPFAMTSGAQFRSAPPPALGSAEYTTAFDEVRTVGSATSATRTADQTQIALFWADGGGTVTPPGHWVRIGITAAASQNNRLSTNARMFALLGMGLADAAICAWDSKYAFNYWRPITGIRQADTDGNPATAQEATWTPLIGTPPFPSFTSGHSTFSATAARVLAGVTRSFASFSAAAAEAGQSRIYGGIHWQFDNTAALAAGSQLGDHVYARYLARIGDLNDDGIVDVVDLHLLQAEMGNTDSPADLDHDGDVDVADQVILVHHFDRRHAPI